MRNYASIGLYDFIAFKRCPCITCLTFFSLHCQMLIIQVKGDPWDNPDREGLIKEAKKVGARPVLVYREIRAGVIGKDKKNGKWITVYLDTNSSGTM